MILLTSLKHIILDALFPLSGAERELLSLSPEEASLKLPHVSDFSGLAVPAQDARLMDSLFAYKDERVAKLVWNIKYKKSAQAVKIGGYVLLQELQAGIGSRFFGTHVAAYWPRVLSPSPSLSPKGPSKSLPIPTTILIPMPITSQRRKERGYNQCELLVDEIEKLADTNKNDFIFEKNLLIRTHHASRQTLKDRADRLESAKGIFGVDSNTIERLGIEKLKDYAIIIIDDVITTGSTMKEAIDTLKNAGFTNVRGLSLAH